MKHNNELPETLSTLNINNNPFTNTDAINSANFDMQADEGSLKIYQAIPPKNISIIGLGYVGAVSCACFASMGHTIIGVDIDEAKVKAINAGTSPILENQLDRILYETHKKNRLSATTSLESAVLQSDITLVSVCTPSADNGSCDTSYLQQAAQDIGKTLKKKKSFHVVMFRSTVPPTTTRNVLIPLIELHSGKKCDIDFGVCFNPEFLREGTAINDFFNPPKTVIGFSGKKSADIASSIYGNIEGEFIHTSLETAEFTKYIDNTWHALKVSFGNELGRLCKAMSVDSHEVMQIFCKDTQLNISGQYLMPGFAFGGSCLPKDTRGITHLAGELSVDIPIISHINASNASHISHSMDLINACNKNTIAIIGLTFKPETDDLRESPALTLYKELKEQGYQVLCYDPFISKPQLERIKGDGFESIQNDFTDSIQTIYDNVEILVTTHKSKYVQDIVMNTPATKHIVDVARLPKPLHSHDKYSGICW